MRLNTAYILVTAVASVSSMVNAVPTFGTPHDIRAIPVGNNNPSSARPTFAIKFTTKTTSDAHDIFAMNTETWIRQFMSRPRVKQNLGQDFDLHFSNHNAEKNKVEFVVTGPSYKCPCKGELDPNSAPGRGKQPVKGEKQKQVFKEIMLMDKNGNIIDDTWTED